MGDTDASVKCLSQEQDGEWSVFQDRFASEEDCAAFLFKSKWPDGFRCPRCSHEHAYTINTRRLPLYQCRICRHQTSLTADTIMEDSRTPLSKWLTAIFLSSHVSSNINAVQLSKRINVTYKTAWSMLHLIRYTISAADMKRSLSGIVKGGLGLCGKLPFRSTIKLHSQEKPILIGVSMDDLGLPTHVKMKVVLSEHMIDSYLLKSGLRSFTERYLEKGTEKVIFAQRFGWNRIRPIKVIFDQVILHLIRTFRGLSKRHLQSYLDEACYRINLALEGKSVFNHLTCLCMSNHRYQSCDVG
jgi:transposase-like protein